MIRIQDATRLYGERVAVDHISLTVEKGEIVGFLGPNGAGKTTTMRMITGSLMPTSGSVSVAGCDMRTQSLQGRRHIGYLPEVVPLYTDMTTRAYLEFVGRLRGLSRRAVRDRIDKVVAVCSLEEYLDTTLGTLSRGFRQRVGLAQAVIHEPEVLILDEPTVGIDPIQVVQARALIRELGRSQTILLSTHILSEVSMLCERVLIIHQGRIVARGRIQDLSAMLRGSSGLRLRVQGPPAQVSDELGKIAGVSDVRYVEPHHLVTFIAGQSPHAGITEAVVRMGWTLLTMTPEEMSLEDIFLNLTTGEAWHP